jgi:4-hydroxy-tetrahydrodipicolinate synthase
MSAMKLSGVVPPVGTPLGDGDRVDEAGLRRLVRYLLDGGVHGIFANGSMGGFAFLTDDEQIRSIVTTVAEVNRAVPVMGGLGETSTSRAVRMAKRIAREGVDYLTVLPPFYFLATQQHLIAYFSEIASAVDLPVFLYDNPVLTKNPIHAETVAELRRRIPNIVGIKVSNQDMTYLQALIGLMRGEADFSILTGSEFLILVALQMGCDGFVGGLHNLCPHMAVALYDEFRAGRIERARELQVEMIATWQLFRHGDIWGAFDEALRYLGICERATGSPYVTALAEPGRKAVHEILDRYVKPYLSVAVSR